MIKRSYVIKQLNNIQGEMNRVMLMEGTWGAIGRGAITLFKSLGSKSWSLGHKAMDAIRTSGGTNVQAALDATKELRLAFNQWKIIGISSLGFAWWNSGRAEARGYNKGYSDYAKNQTNVQANKEEIEAYNLVMGVPPIPSSQNMSEITVANEANEKQQNAFEKIWNTIESNYHKFLEAIRDGIKTIGAIPFMTLGFGLALSFMLAGTVMYYINVKGEISASLKKVFSDTFSAISNASGLEQIVRVMMSPILLIMKFIEASPLGTALFLMGFSMFSLMVVCTAIGWEVIFSFEREKPKGQVQQSKAQPQIIINPPGMNSSPDVKNPADKPTTQNV